MKIKILTLFFVLAQISISWAAPKIMAPTTSYDFGNIIQGDKVEYVFKFRNIGDEVLEVGNVRSSCGCTAALLSASRVAPGDFGELRTTFDSERFKGKVSKLVTFDTNDPKQKQLSYTLHGSIKVELLAQPERIKWGKVAAGTPLTATVTIVNRGTETVTLKRTATTSTAVSAKLGASKIAPGESVELQVSGEFPENKSRIGGYVIIDTDYSRIPQIRVPVSARLSQ